QPRPRGGRGHPPDSSPATGPRRWHHRGVRLWSMHPRYLDRQGLTAAWREALLAQAVLAGRTRGYTRHPQLERFRGTADPVGVVGSYLTVLRTEAVARGYAYDVTRVDRPDPDGRWLGSLT